MERDIRSQPATETGSSSHLPGSAGEISVGLKVTQGRLDEPELQDVAALIAAAEESDGNPPFSDQTWVELRGAEDPSRVSTITAWLADGTGGDGELAGAAVVTFPDGQDARGPDGADGDSATDHPDSGAGAGVLELVVHPSCRGQGVGSTLVRRLTELQRAGQADARGGVHAWAHGNHVAAARLAEEFGYTPVRELLRLRLTRHEEPAGAETPATPDTDVDRQAQAELWDATPPEGVTIRPFVPGQDERAWLRANAAAFADHPEQGGIDLEDLRARQHEDWFDPEGFLLAEDASGELLGFHWTKIHPGADGHRPLGEVYVLGVVPGAQGRGLGRLLTVVGIRYLQHRGVGGVMLYVDADNASAVRLYRRLGFVRWDSDVMYAPVSGS